MRRSIAEGLYQVAWGAALVGGAPYWLVRRGLHGAEMRERWGEWEGLGAGGGALWVHAASVGEARAARGLLGSLERRGERALVTVVTPAARALEEELIARGALAVRHAPLDFAPFVERAFRRAPPRGLLFLETEIWPGLLRAARERRLPVAFVSARLTEGGLRRWGAFRRALTPLLDGVRVAAQSEEDGRRWRALGVADARVAVTGNIKYDRPAGPLGEQDRRRQRRGWERVAIFGSVRSGEIDAVVTAIREGARGAGATLFVIAPRHPGRVRERLLRKLEGLLPLVERTERRGELLPASDGRQAEILVVGTMGELPEYYALGDVAFVGGTLAAIGGHNLFEAAEWGLPVLFGPSTGTVAEVATALQAAGGGFQVADGEQLGRRLRQLLGDEQGRRRAAGGALEAARRLGGALERTLAVLERWEYPLAPAGPGGARGEPGPLPGGQGQGR
ncbi:MAG: hypothetical protein KAY32_10970 [Candidatus Eisenbacteria sp.]|nr:hypothetical protein [Candidatus Eisenbacteria bacterium]